MIHETKNGVPARSMKRAISKKQTLRLQNKHHVDDVYNKRTKWKLVKDHALLVAFYTAAATRRAMRLPGGDPLVLGMKRRKQLWLLRNNKAHYL